MRFAGSAILQKSQADRLAADYDGRPADKGDMLEALKRAHPERDPANKRSKRGKILGNLPASELDHGSLDHAADRGDRD
jgi:hypothetical protein